MGQVRLSQAAQADVIEILAWSDAQFGADARHRYEALLATAIRDVTSVRDGIGSTARPESGAGVLSWHLRQSRHHSEADPVHRPRHFVIYRLDGDVVVIGRILHDAIELRRHLDPSRSWE